MTALLLNDDNHALYHRTLYLLVGHLSINYTHSSGVHFLRFYKSIFLLST